MKINFELEMGTLQWSRHKKKDTSEEMSYLVDYTGKNSNLLEDIEKLDRFAESVEDDLLNLMIDKAES
ncbi:MAG: hypothetical protein II874_08365 [Bacteroidales bacterium]|nr:hypothetical protein [Bacteroidales bacterium]MBQ3766732.1 hypothetical protein [Bacteroidales bacterium]